MASQATVTSKIGPALTVTGIVLTNVVKVNYDLLGDVVEIVQSDPPKITHFDLAATTTVTMTVASGNWTVTISQ